MIYINKKYNYVYIFVSIIILEALGFISSYFTNFSAESYGQLNMPPFSPPWVVFPIVWTILYAALGFIAYLIFDFGDRNVKIIFIIHMLLNYSYTYFVFSRQDLYFGVAIIMLLLVTLYYVKSWVINISGFANLLCWVYGAWLTYALFLNIMLIMVN